MFALMRGRVAHENRQQDCDQQGCPGHPPHGAAPADAFNCPGQGQRRTDIAKRPGSQDNASEGGEDRHGIVARQDVVTGHQNRRTAYPNQHHGNRDPSGPLRQRHDRLEHRWREPACVLVVAGAVVGIDQGQAFIQ